MQGKSALLYVGFCWVAYKSRTDTLSGELSKQASLEAFCDYLALRSLPAVGVFILVLVHTEELITLVKFH